MKMSALAAMMAVALLVAPSARAGPVCGTLEEDPDTGSKTWHALKTWFHPMCQYVTQQLPQKTPTVLVEDVKDTASDVKTWAEQNKVLQGLNSALTPVKNWVKDTHTTLKDKSFHDMYNDVKESVQKLDDNVGAWLSSRVNEGT